MFRQWAKSKFAQVPAGARVWGAYVSQLLRSGASKVDTAPIDTAHHRANTEGLKPMLIYSPTTLSGLKLIDPAVSKIQKMGTHVRARITGQILKGLIPSLHVPVPACKV